MERKRLSDEVDDYHFALLAAITANSSRNGKAKRRPFTPKDFMMRPPAKPVQTPVEMLAYVEALNKRFGGKDTRKGALG